MKVLVTGATGFTGSCLAKELVKRGRETYGLVRSQKKSDELLKWGVTPKLADLTDAAAVSEAVKGMDVVYHIAASYRESGATEAVYRNVNVLGTRNIIDACRKYGVKRLVHCSTVGVHGNIKNPPANEDAPFQPDDEYQVTKLEGEMLVQEAIKQGLPAVVFRPVGIFGPGDTRFLKLFRSISNGRFVMFGSGNVLYHLTFIEDLVNGIIACGEHPAASGRTYIIAGPQATTLNELVKRIAGTLGVRPPKLRVPFSALWIASILCEAIFRPLRLNPPLFRRRADFFRKDRSFDSSRIQRELGVVPRVSLEEGLRRTTQWYRDNKFL